MLKPAFVANMSEAMADVYGAVTDKILINLARHFPFLKAGVELPGSFDYQARMLAQMGQINKETIDIIMSGLDGADQALRQALEASIIHALEAEEPKLRKAAEKGILQPPSVPEVVPGQMQAFKAYYRQSADKLNLVNTVMLESTQAAYTATVSDIANKIARTQSILNVGAGEVVTGVTAYNQAVRESVRKMVSNGITGFIDHGGHHWSPEAYAAMDIRTTMNNVARAATWERNESYGNDLYQVSWHNGARPLCYPWQGKVISRSDMVREVEDLDGNSVHVYAQSETSYGEVAGLFGINCGHYAMVFIPGISTLYDVPQNEEENAKDYEESQQQRALERKLREEKRDLEVLKAQGASEDLLKAQQAKVKKASHDIDDFCEETGRTRRRDREATPINAKFPPKGSYDSKLFPTEERDKMQEFFTGKKPQTTADIIKEAEKPQEENSLEELFADLWGDDSDTSAYVAPAEEEQFRPSTKYGSFGIQNKDYPKELQLSESEETYIENFLKDARGKRTPKDFDYQPIMGQALRPVKTLEQNEAKRFVVQKEIDDATAKLSEAEKMIAQRKAEGYKGKSREQSFRDWKKLEKELEQAEDDIVYGQILEHASVGKQGIQYWYSQRKNQNTRLKYTDFASKVIDREKFALEHGFNGLNYD